MKITFMLISHPQHPYMREELAKKQKQQELEMEAQKQLEKEGKKRDSEESMKDSVVVVNT